MHHNPSKRYQQLQPEERMTIASLLQQQFTITQIAQRLKRSSSTISRELKRNTQDGCYASQVATTCARQRCRHGRPARKLHSEGILFGVVHHTLMLRWSPEQISLTLAFTIADQINNRPRKGLGVRSPLAVYTELLHNS